MFRTYVEKKAEFAVEAKALLNDIRQNLGIKALTDLKILNRYDIEGITKEQYARAKNTILSEPPVDNAYDEEYDFSRADRFFAVEYLPGQFDQRADSAAQCIQILTQQDKPMVKAAKVILLFGDIQDEELDSIKNYYINPVEMREASIHKPDKLDFDTVIPDDVEILDGFQYLNEEDLLKLREELGLAMSEEDFKFCQNYFKSEKRNPTITEIRVIDTYWSDHCRHTTFMTELVDIEIEDGKYSDIIRKAFDEYIKSREYVYSDRKKDMCLMDMATIYMKESKKGGRLNDLEESDEINACSIKVQADVDGKSEEWLVMFKNETHNHPTEIEPFGGAATCLGGAIRDPLSGRAYVYGAMRVTGSGDPRTPIEKTLNGKLPQRKITTGAAAGYSSYGNQIGLATGQVREIYHDGFVAKRMEVGAVIAAAPRENVVRQKPECGDLIILVGGRTGRDGCGGATGSSKEHDEDSIKSCGAEVQKGNPPTERKIQRLFRKPEVSKLIKKCNDFGAGGVSVAVGELADSLIINLDAVPKKYEGLDGTELAISESQERMAVVVAAKDKESFLRYAYDENLEAVEIAVVSDDGRLIMKWRDKTIVDIKREFLDTNGVKQRAFVKVDEIKTDTNFCMNKIDRNSADLKKSWMENLSDLNVCSQKGLGERFDGSIGAGTVLMPFGGKYQDTPQEGLVMKLPVVNGSTNTGTIMTYGYNPMLSMHSPFHGAVYSIVEAVSKVVALGGKYENIRLTLQEYFEKLGKDSSKWGKPFSALLGAYYTQKMLGIPAIGGKDSMSGTFKELNVPPTLVAFAVDTVNVERIISRELKEENSKVVLIPAVCNEDGIPDFDKLKNSFNNVTRLITEGRVLSSSIVKFGGVAAAISEMCFGNRIGFKFDDGFDESKLFEPDYGAIILEVGKADKLDDIAHIALGYTDASKSIEIQGISIGLEEAHSIWTKTLEPIFPTKTEITAPLPIKAEYTKGQTRKSNFKLAKPRVVIPVFPGTNCEYDTARAFEKAGALVDTLVIRNNTSSQIEESINILAKTIEQSQIIAIPGGFSGGDEPDGSGKFIATAFRNPAVKEAVMKLLKNRDGLILGICNGFQALVKLGLLPYGEIIDMEDKSPTLTYNSIGKHMSCMVRTRVASNLSPWLHNVKVGDIHTIAMSHGEGRFVADEAVIRKMISNGQIATQYVDFDGNPTYDIGFNPNGSIHAIEGITSPDGRIFGKMGHSERMGRNICINVPGDKDQKLFQAGVDYFS